MSEASSRLSVFNNDKNNKLSNKQCEKFVKDYQDYKNGKISTINNPKTNKPLSDIHRIIYIYTKCKKKLNDDDSPSSSSSSADSNDNEIILDSYTKVQEIIYIPINTITENRKLISSLFSKPIIFEKGLYKLKEYLEINRNASATQNEYIHSYYNILEKISTIIRDIYYNNTNTASILAIQYGWRGNYNYDPFRMDSASSAIRPNIITSIKNTRDEIKKMWKNTLYTSSDEVRANDIKNLPNIYMCDIITYSANNRNKADILRNIENNIEKYLALQFILVLIRDNLTNNPQIVDTVNKHILMIDTLITKNILQVCDNIDTSVSVSKSLSLSGTPRSSSSNHSHYQSKANIEKYKKTREDLIEEITRNNINSSDPYLGDEWKDMTLHKLRNVISISSVINNKTHRHAFYVRTLYQFWRVSEKSPSYQKIKFANPYNRALFSEEDKEAIMNAMLKMYPRLQRPAYGDGRKDIDFQATAETMNYITLKFFYKLKIQGNNDMKGLLVPITSTKIRLSYPDQDIDPSFIPQILLENIVIIIRDNKMFGKNIPIKPLDVLLEYNGTTINTMEQYMDFFNKIKNAL